MGRKLLVSLAMEGKFANQGLQALDDDDDMLTAMARELVTQKGVGEKSDALWKQIQQQHTRLTATTSVVAMEPPQQAVGEDDLAVSGPLYRGVALYQGGPTGPWGGGGPEWRRQGRSGGNTAGLRDALATDRHLLVRFEPPTKAGELLLTRTHPVVEGLAGYLLDTALDPQLDSVARRCGAIRTHAVTRRTTVLLLRCRYHIITRQGAQEKPLLAEDCLTVAFEGSPVNPAWLESSAAEALLGARPDANVQPDQAAEFIRKVNLDFAGLIPHLNEMVRHRGDELLAAHTRVRTAARMQGVRHHVEAQFPPDVLGVYVYLPALPEAGKAAS